MKKSELQQIIREEIMKNKNQLKRIQELEGLKNSNPVNVLVQILQQAIKLADQNIENADNFDLVDFSQTLEKYVDKLIEIGNFENYNED